MYTQQGGFWFLRTKAGLLKVDGRKGSDRDKAKSSDSILQRS